MSGLLVAWAVALSIQSHAQSAYPGPSDQLAQTLGTSCKTEYGICPVPPQPLNSVCFCADSQGVVTE